MDLDVLILRDPRESVKKCSLTPLRGMRGIRFVNYDRERRVAVGSRVLLDPNGEEIGPADAGLPLLVLDCAWRRVSDLRAVVDGDLMPRRLPPLVTAYPRRSKTFDDPHEGLASVEALYAALVLLGDQRLELLEGYRWAQEFLARNEMLEAIASSRSKLAHVQPEFARRGSEPSDFRSPELADDRADA